MIIHKDVKQLKKKAAQIMRIYNSSTGWQETLTINTPKTMHIVATNGVKGGLICEVYGNKMAMIMYAAFDEKHRGLGHCRRAINEAVNHFNQLGIKLVAVQVDLFSDVAKVWEALGFTLSKQLFNFTQVMLCVPQDEFNALSIAAGSTQHDHVTPELVNEFQEHKRAITRG